jgi:cytochrome c553
MRRPETPARNSKHGLECLLTGRQFQPPQKSEMARAPGRLGSFRIQLRMLFVPITMLFSMYAAAQTIEDKAQLCAACHGEKGTPSDKTIPIIWGQAQGYLYLQLRDYQHGTRKNEIMSPIASALDRKEMMDLAAYFSAKPWPGTRQAAPPQSVVKKADAAIGSVGCTSCHLDHYQGAGTTPRLSAQHEDYLKKTMLDFKSGARANNPGMTSLMKAVSDEDIAAIAAYLASFSF